MLYDKIDTVLYKMVQTLVPVHYTFIIIGVVSKEETLP